MSQSAEVRIWGTPVGQVVQDTPATPATWWYDEDFIARGIELSPMMMPLNPRPYEFRQLDPGTFHWLPGLLSDSLPDTFGNAVLRAHVRSQGRNPDAMTTVERLLAVGNRGMGALTFHPAGDLPPATDGALDLVTLARVASDVLADRAQMQRGLPADPKGGDYYSDLLAVAGSPGGARAKVLVAWNQDTGVLRPADTSTEPGYAEWLVKLDGVRGSGDHGLPDPQGYGRIEYAYWLMAREAGIAMTPARLIEEGGRAHFATERFDRIAGRGHAAGMIDRVHMQSLGALAHLDFRQPRVHGYEDAIDTANALSLPIDAREQLVRTAAFNALTRNQDDHVKNISFLMGRDGLWSLAPAYDLTYAYNPGGDWTAAHQMSINGKFDDFSHSDLMALAQYAALPKPAARRVIDEVRQSVNKWLEHADHAGLPEVRAVQIRLAHRTLSPARTAGMTFVR